MHKRCASPVVRTVDNVALNSLLTCEFDQILWVVVEYRQHVIHTVMIVNVVELLLREHEFAVLQVVLLKPVFCVFTNIVLLVSRATGDNDHMIPLRQTPQSAMRTWNHGHVALMTFHAPPTLKLSIVCIVKT